METRRCLNFDKIFYQVEEKSHDQKKLIVRRYQVHQMYFEGGMSKNKIVRETGMSNHFVIKWTQSAEQDMTEDHRGRKRGDRQKWTKQTEDRILKLHQELSASDKEYFTGATAISQIWQQRYDDDPPPLRTIGQIMKDLGLPSRPRGRSKGAAKYLRYPETTLYGGYLGDRVMEADFIQRRYLQGSGQPLHFVGFSAKQDPKFRNYKRIEDLTVDNFLQACDEFLTLFDKPDALKLDNASTFIGSVSGKRTLSRVMLYLLKRKIIPVFSVPRKPFSQGSIEGNNSVFSRFFWNRRHFEDLEDLDRQLGWFNAASLRYSGYKKPEPNDAVKEFIPKVCFLRQIRESETHPGHGMIDVVNEEILLPPEWINFFVFAEWNLKAEKLTVNLEEDTSLKILKHIDFKINKTTLNKLNQGGELLSCI